MQWFHSNHCGATTVLKDSHCINGGNLEVHGVDGGEDVGSPLYNTLPGLRHGNRSTPGQEDGLVAGAEGEYPREPTLDENDL